jgi:hypothetical protein
MRCTVFRQFRLPANVEIHSLLIDGRLYTASVLRVLNYVIKE